jgi:hypothetical protein
MTNESLFSGLRVLDIASFIAGPNWCFRGKINALLTAGRNRLLHL